MVYRKGGQSSSEKTEARPKPDVGAKENLKNECSRFKESGKNSERRAQ